MSEYFAAIVHPSGDDRHPSSMQITVHHVSCGVGERAHHKVEVDKGDINRAYIEVDGRRVRQLKCQTCRAKPPAPETMRYKRWKRKIPDSWKVMTG